MESALLFLILSAIPITGLVSVLVRNLPSPGCELRINYNFNDYSL
jgi:hypothetical protein